MAEYEGDAASALGRYGTPHLCMEAFGTEVEFGGTLYEFKHDFPPNRLTIGLLIDRTDEGD